MSGRVIFLGVRYRLASGLRTLLSVWTGLIVAVVAVIDLDSGRAPMGSGSSLIRAFAALIVVTAIVSRPALRQAMLHGNSQILTLPLTGRTLLLIDAISVALFLLPPLGLFLALGNGRELLSLAAIWLIGSIAGGVIAHYPVEATSRRATSASMPYQLRWMLASSSLPSGVLMLLACAGAALLAIRNNDVVSLSAIARIEQGCAAIGISILVYGFANDTARLRPYRLLETTLPISPPQRIRSAMVNMLPLLAPVILIPVAIPFALALLPLLLLLGNVATLRDRKAGLPIFGTGLSAALLAFLSAPAALLAVLVALPFAWRAAISAERTSDWPILAA